MVSKASWYPWDLKFENSCQHLGQKPFSRMLHIQQTTTNKLKFYFLNQGLFSWMKVLVIYLLESKKS